MAQVLILAAAAQHAVCLCVNGREHEIPFDGEFHPLDDELVPALRDSDVKFELRDYNENAAEAGGEAGSEAGAGDGLGVSTGATNEGSGADAAGENAGDEGGENAADSAPELSQLDRDGDGEAGGSLPGNETAPAAKGKRK